MGYGTYWENGRWQGNGVPAYCDYPGCNEVIHRGLAYQHEEDNEGMTPNIFCCKKHKRELLDSFYSRVDYSRECQDWLAWITSDVSWSQWRKENPDIVKRYKSLLKEREGK